MKKIIFLLFLFASPVKAADNPLPVYVFTLPTCVHCQAEKEFLAEISSQSAITINNIDTADNKNIRLFQKVGETLNLEVGPVPLTVIGDQYLLGFDTTSQSGETIKGLISRCQKETCPDLVASLQEELGKSSSLLWLLLPAFLLPLVFGLLKRKK